MIKQMWYTVIMYIDLTQILWNHSKQKKETTVGAWIPLEKYKL